MLVLKRGSIGAPRENGAFLPFGYSSIPGRKAEELTVGPAGHYAELVPPSPTYADKMRLDQGRCQGQNLTMASGRCIGAAESEPRWSDSLERITENPGAVHSVHWTWAWSEHPEVPECLENGTALVLGARFLPCTASIVSPAQRQALEFLAVGDPAVLRYPTVLPLDQSLNLVVRCHRSYHILFLQPSLRLSHRSVKFAGAQATCG